MKKKKNVRAHNEPAGLFSSSKTRERSFFVLCTHDEKDVETGLEHRHSRPCAVALNTVHYPMAT